MLATTTLFAIMDALTKHVATLYSAPQITTALSVPIHKETVGLRRWSANRRCKESRQFYSKLDKLPD